MWPVAVGDVEQDIEDQLLLALELAEELECLALATAVYIGHANEPPLRVVRGLVRTQLKVSAYILSTLNNVLEIRSRSEVG